MEEPVAPMAASEPATADPIEPIEEAPLARDDSLDAPTVVDEAEQANRFSQIPAAPDNDRSDEDDTFAEATLIEPRSGPEQEERAFEEAAIAQECEPSPAERSAIEEALPVSPAPAFSREERADWRGPPVAESQSDDFVPFQADDDFDPPRRRWLPIVAAFVLIVALSAAFWFFAPDAWKAQLGIVEASSPLALVTDHMDRQKLESGNELLTVTGRVINPTGSDQPVPQLSAQLRSRTGEVVYSWVIAPPARSLAPGASASFNSAEVNVPPGGDQLTITLGGNRT